MENNIIHKFSIRHIFEFNSQIYIWKKFSLCENCVKCKYFFFQTKIPSLIKFYKSELSNRLYFKIKKLNYLSFN